MYCAPSGTEAQCLPVNATGSGFDVHLGTINYYHFSPAGNKESAALNFTIQHEIPLKLNCYAASLYETTRT